MLLHSNSKKTLSQGGQGFWWKPLSHFICRVRCVWFLVPPPLHLGARAFSPPRYAAGADLVESMERSWERRHLSYHKNRARFHTKTRVSWMPPVRRMLHSFHFNCKIGIRQDPLKRPVVHCLKSLRNCAVSNNLRNARHGSIQILIVLVLLLRDPKL